MALKLANLAVSKLAASITEGATTLSIQNGDTGKFPVLAEGDWHPATIIDQAGNLEIVRVTARAGATLTIARAQEGTTAKAFAAGSRIDIRLTAATVLAILQDLNTLDEHIDDVVGTLNQAIATKLSKSGGSMSWILKLVYDYPQLWWGDAATGTGWRIIKDTPEGQVGSLVFQCSTDRWVSGANMKTAMSLGADGKSILYDLWAVTQLRVPNFADAEQFNGFLRGTGDGASYNTYNFSLSGWWGMAMRTYDGTINGYYDFRSGTWDVKNGYKVNGNYVPHAGNKASAADIAAGTPNKFPDAEAVKAAFPMWSSAQQTWAAGATLVVAHTLGAAPKEVFLEFVCKAAGGGYSVGDRVLMPSSTAARDENYTNTGFSVSVDETNIRVHFASNGISTVVKGGGGVFFSGGSVFDVIVRGRL